jgi:tetratricopeptide (TPR) repeat protein
MCKANHEGKKQIDRLLELAGNHRNAAQISQAMAFYQKAEKLADHVGDRKRQVDALSSIAFLYHQQGNPQSRPLFDRAMQLIQRYSLEKTLEAADTMGRFGSRLIWEGKINEGLKMFQAALQITIKHGDKERQAINLGDVGMAYWYKGNLLEALKYYEEQKILGKTHSKRGELTALTRSGDVYRDLGNFPQAFQYYRRLLNLAREGGYKREEADAYARLGEINGQINRFSEAENYLLKAHNTYRAINYGGQEALCLVNLGNVFKELGNLEKAEQCYDKSLLLLQGSQYQETVVSTYLHIHLGDLYRRRRIYKKAKDSLGNAIAGDCKVKVYQFL